MARNSQSLEGVSATAVPAPRCAAQMRPPHHRMTGCPRMLHEPHHDTVERCCDNCLCVDDLKGATTTRSTTRLCNILVNVVINKLSAFHASCQHLVFRLVT
eukprot:3786475-Amphidinium_carterae.1